jgi:hypothetical protein
VNIENLQVMTDEWFEDAILDQLAREVETSCKRTVQTDVERVLNLNTATPRLTLRARNRNSGGLLCRQHI